MKYLTILLLVVASSSAMIGCLNKHNHDHNTPEYTSAYVCPMHCDGSGSDSAGTCPVCGMDYVKNEKTSSEK